MSPVTARAHTNIALVKYWGKRDPGLNLPAVGSLSLTLDRFFTTTSVAELAGDEDLLLLDGAEASPAERARVSRFLDLVRARAGGGPRLQITSENTVPTAAGLASSASAFAALALAASRALGLRLEGRELSKLARQGSGSAARSLFGGLVLLHRGERDDGEDCFAEPLSSPLDVRLVVARCGAGRKKLGSTEAMERTARTSPFYAPWVSTHPADLEEGRAAAAAGELARLGEVMERSTLKMHATGFGAAPPFWYLAPATLAVMERVQALRHDGLPCWFTMDAGPHVKVLCAAADAAEVTARVGEVAGVVGVDVAGPGPGAFVLEGE